MNKDIYKVNKNFYYEKEYLEIINLIKKIKSLREKKEKLIREIWYYIAGVQAKEGSKEDRELKKLEIKRNKISEEIMELKKEIFATSTFEDVENLI